MPAKVKSYDATITVTLRTSAEPCAARWAREIASEILRDYPAVTAAEVVRIKENDAELQVVKAVAHLLSS